MIYLTAEDIAQFNADQVGRGGIRDVGLIESACMRPQITVFDMDAYPTIWEKAAALFQSLACNHPFLDGNKRTAWLSMAVFLGVNGYPLKSPVDTAEAVHLVLAVATSTVRDVRLIASGLAKFFR